MTLASATDLTRWADRREAQSVLPQLVRRLITATTSELLRLSIRAGEGVALAGWDGIAEAATATGFTPAGLSVWEMGVGSPASKANSDYRKRTDDPDGIDRATTTFVFVTSRRWTGKDAWVRDRNAEGVWADVRVHDADDLETWLEMAPSVHAWFSSLIGLDPYEVESLSLWWDNWSGATEPMLPAAVLTSGRARHADKLNEMLGAAPASTSVVAESQDEAVAFVAAVLHDRPQLAERAVVVRSPHAWRQIAVSEHPLILIPVFERPELTPAVRSGHHVLVPFGREASESNGLVLPRLDRHGIQAALTDAGLPRDSASSLATLGRQSLLALRRKLATNPDVNVPEWSRPEYARDAALMSLVGAWRDHLEGDGEAVSQIWGRPYGDVLASVSRWSMSSNPPVRLTGSIWMVAAKADVWALTARALTRDDVNRFRRVATDVLQAADPTLDLPREQRMAAGLLGVQRRYTGVLMGGIADTLALAAATSGVTPLPGDWTGASLATAVVRDVLTAANEDATGQAWHAVAGALPLLAEAAPDAFLSAVEAGTGTADGPVFRLFQDDEMSSWLMSGSPHSNLLWALETLSWSPATIGRAALVLARLHRLEPGGTTGNRPFRSLVDTLLLWRPGTTATLAEHLQVVDLLRTREPDVAWELMLDLVPARHESASGTASPTHREWKPDTRPEHLPADLDRAVKQMVQRLIADAGHNGGRWVALLGRAAGSLYPLVESVSGALEALAPDVFAEDDRVGIYRTIREIVRRHSEFPDADWSMPQEETQRLGVLADRFEPVAVTDRHAELFDAGGIEAFELDGDDYDSRQGALRGAQDAALREVLEHTDVQQFPSWIQSFVDPEFGARQVGASLARVRPNDEAPLSLVASDDVGTQRLGVEFARGLTYVHGVDWSVWAGGVTRGAAAEWSTEARVRFLRALPALKPTWALASEWNVDAAYWERVHPYELPWDGPLAIVAADHLLEYGQPRTALGLYWRILYRDADAVPAEQLAEALEQMFRTAETPFDSEDARHIGRTLDRLAELDFDTDQLAALEWAFLPLFQHQRRATSVLRTALSENASLFVDLITMIYRAEGDVPQEADDNAAYQARTASLLLDSWRGVPGMQGDGTLDGDALTAWVQEARAGLDAVGRLKSGDHEIGRMLRYGPSPETAEAETAPRARVNWPAEPIRDLIDGIEAEALERGFEREVYNSRGTTMRGMTDGGDQERSLVDQYRAQAAFSSIRHPRTAAMLRRIADSFERDAERHDRDAELTQDTWR